MNAKTSKQIRKIARSLPDVYIRKVVNKNVRGSELLKKDINTFDGQKINKNSVYRWAFEEIKKVDHAERIKNVYWLQGEPGIRKYIIHARTTALQQEQQKLKQKAANKPGLINRLLSFIKSLFK